MAPSQAAINKIDNNETRLDIIASQHENQFNEQ